MVPVPLVDQFVMATCASADSPPLTAPPLKFGVAALPDTGLPNWLYAQQQPDGPLTMVCNTTNYHDVLTINVFPADQPDHPLTFSGSPVKSQDYPWYGQVSTPFSIDRSAFPSGVNSYARATCISNASPPVSAPALTLIATAFPAGGTFHPLSLAEFFSGPQEVGVACSLDQSVTGPLTITAFATSEGPNGQHHVSQSGEPFEINNVMELRRDFAWSQFPPGEVTLTCASSDSPPATAQPLILQSPLQSPSAVSVAAATPTPTPEGTPGAPRPTPAVTSTAVRRTPLPTEGETHTPTPTPR
jgi:hypothetical protein